MKFHPARLLRTARLLGNIESTIFWYVFMENQLTPRTTPTTMTTIPIMAPLLDPDPENLISNIKN